MVYRLLIYKALKGGIDGVEQKLPLLPQKARPEGTRGIPVLFRRTCQCRSAAGTGVNGSATETSGSAIASKRTARQGRIDFSYRELVDS